MNAFNIFLIILVLSASGLAQASEPPKAIDDAGANVQNFDSQVIDIFKSLVENPQIMRATTDVGTDDQKAALKTIYKKFIDHEMFLKNVVYRPDLDVIRVTWGDRKNYYVVKIAYKTGRDKVLSNSIYADKKAVFDVKIMYRKPNSEYDYMRLENLRMVQGKALFDHDVFHVEYKLTNEECGFCHTLAKYDNSPSGIFFPRYQEGQDTGKIGGMSTFFDPSKLELKKKADAIGLGLPEMMGDFYFLKVNQANILRNDKDTQKIMRALIELPQLLEVMSMDNHKSYCLFIDSGEIGKSVGFGRNDYICADDVARKLHVKMTNSVVSNKTASSIYTVPYYK
jgi:hypothetical protein